MQMPQVDFSILGDLGKTYKDARNERTLADLGKGLADGTLDYRKAAGMAAQAGKLDTALGLMKLGEDKAAQKDFTEKFAPLLLGQGGEQPSQPPPSRPTPRPMTLAGIGQPQAMPNDPQITPPPRAPVQPSARVWGDQEAQNAGLYEKPNFPQRFAGAEPLSPLDNSTGAPPPRPQMAQAAPPQRVQAQPQTAPQPSPRTNPIQNNIPALMAVMTHPGASAGQRKMAEIALTEAIKSPDNLKEYDFYQKQTLARGEQPLPLLDWTIKIKQAGAQAITVDNRGENEESKVIGKTAGELYKTTMEAMAASPARIQNLNRMEALLAQVEQGKIQPARMSISAWFKSAGLDDTVAERLGLDPKGVGTAQAISALTNELTVGKLGPGGFPTANFSNTDRTFIEEIAPKLGDDPVSNKLKIEAARRLARLDIEKGRELSKWRTANKGKSVAEFEVDWADKISKRDLFGDLVAQARQTQPSERPQANPTAGPSRSEIEQELQRRGVR